MNENLDFEIYTGKTLRDLCKEIIDRSQNKKDQVDILLSDARGYIKNTNDAIILLPQIKALLDVGVKNDEQLIKLAAVLQKVQSTQIESEDGINGLLSEEDKTQLLQNNAEALKAIEVEIVSKIPLITLPSSSSLSL